MSNSSLVTYVLISPNKNSPRNHVIDTITIHHVAGCASAKSVCQVFNSPTRAASCNYAIGNDGDIALCVDERDRSWCSSSKINDNRAITIEVSNDYNGVKNKTWTVSEAAMKSLINLVADICKRNGIKQLVWSNTTYNRVNHLNGANVTLHKDFAATGCPGPYLEKEIPNRVIPAVNAILTGVKPKTTIYKVQIGAFKTKSFADNQCARAKSLGYSCYVYKESNIYRVQIGAFTVKANAEKYRLRAINDGFKNAFIVEK